MQKFKLDKFFLIILAIFALGVAFDLVTKSLSSGANSTFIAGFISFYYTLNTGAGFSILSGQTLFLTIFSAVLFVGLIFLIIFYRPQNKLFSVGIGLILAGAFGNMFDRIFFGAVRDFIKLDFINFPIFNIADCCLTVGAIIICVWLVFFYGKGDKNGNKNISNNN